MAKDKENDIKRGKSKERKDANKKPKKNKSAPKGQGKVVECTLRKIVKKKKKGRYTELEAEKIYDSVKVKKSGFPAYTASIYPNMVQFTPKKKGAKIPPINYRDIEQIVKIPNHADSFLLHVPKTKKTKWFCGLFTWNDPDGGKKLESALKKYQDSRNSDEGKKSQAATPDRTTPISIVRPRSESLVISASAPSAYSCSESDVVDAGPFRETYTIYTPNRYINRRAYSGPDFSISSSRSIKDKYRGVDDDGTSYEDDDEEEDYEYICRDPNSIFYGERMSPKSQYVDKLLRATAQMNIYE